MPRLIWVFAGRTGHFDGFVVHRLKCNLGLFIAGQIGLVTNQGSTTETAGPTRYIFCPTGVQEVAGLILGSDPATYLLFVEI